MSLAITAPARRRTDWKSLASLVLAAASAFAAPQAGAAIGSFTFQNLEANATADSFSARFSNEMAASTAAAPAGHSNSIRAANGATRGGFTAWTTPFGGSKQNIGYTTPTNRAATPAAITVDAQGHFTSILNFSTAAGRDGYLVQSASFRSAGVILQAGARVLSLKESLALRARSSDAAWAIELHGDTAAVNPLPFALSNVRLWTGISASQVDNWESTLAGGSPTTSLADRVLMPGAVDSIDLGALPVGANFLLAYDVRFGAMSEPVTHIFGSAVPAPGAAATLLLAGALSLRRRR